MAGFVILLITFSVAEKHNTSKALSVGECSLTFNPLEKLPLHGEKGGDTRFAAVRTTPLGTTEAF